MTATQPRIGKIVVNVMLWLALAGSATAATTSTWSGAASGAWGTAGNWVEATLPPFDGTDTLIEPTPTAANPTQTLDAARRIGALTFQAGGYTLNTGAAADRLNVTLDSVPRRFHRLGRLRAAQQCRGHHSVHRAGTYGAHARRVGIRRRSAPPARGFSFVHVGGSRIDQVTIQTGESRWEKQQPF